PREDGGRVQPDRPPPLDGGHLGVRASHVGELDEGDRLVGLPAVVRAGPVRRPTLPTVARRVAVTGTTGTVGGVRHSPCPAGGSPEAPSTPIDVTSDGAVSNGRPRGTARTKCRKCRTSDTTGAWFSILRPTATRSIRVRRASVGQAQRVVVEVSARGPGLSR